MKQYIIRSVKYFISIVIMFIIVLGIAFAFSKTPEGTSFFDLFTNGSLPKMIAFFLVVSAIYPKFGYNKKELYINYQEYKETIENLFLEAGYENNESESNYVIYVKRNIVLRIIRLFEDGVRIDINKDEEKIIISGLSKDVLRFARQIFYLCNKNNNQE